MRNLFLVAYDIADPKRLREMFTKMRGFGDHAQLSIFLCPLTPTEKVLLMAGVKGTINHAEDRVMVVNLGPVDGRGGACVEFIGLKGDLPESGAVVI